MPSLRVVVIEGLGQVDGLSGSVESEALGLELGVGGEELLGSLLSGRTGRLGPLVVGRLSTVDVGRISLVAPLHDTLDASRNLEADVAVPDLFGGGFLHDTDSSVSSR